MADPLASLVEREYPEPTNFFDPAASQSVISKYASARRRSQSSALLADSAMKLSRAEEDRERLARDRVVWDRMDEEYNDRQAAKRLRGDFLRSMTRDIDPKSEDYTRQVTEFKAGLPPELQDDDVINSILTSMNAEADDYRSRRNAEATRQGNYEFWQKKFDQGAGFKFKHIKPEDYAANRLEDGTPDWQALQAIEGERERSFKAGEFDRRLKAVNEGRLQLVKSSELSKRGRDRRSQLDKWIVEDRTAFPRWTDALAEEFKKSTGKESVDLTLLKDNPKWRDAYLRAAAWDKNPLFNELNAALDYDTAEEYVNKVKGLTEDQKERRRKMWEHAHRDDVFEELDAAPSAKTPSSAAPALKGKKILTPDARADILKRAGGDPRKAMRLAEEEGY